MEILYIEDDLIDQIALQRLIKRKKGIVCQVANDIKEAEYLIQSNRFDLILSDYYLAGHTVEDVLSKFTDLPVFLVSGSEDRKKIEGLYKNGLKGHFKKPIMEVDLERLLKQESRLASFQKSTIKADFSQPLVFDFTFLRAISPKSLQFKKEFIQIFMRTAKKESENILLFLQQEDVQAIGESVHKLKSNLRMMGLTQLLLKADELEEICFSRNHLDVFHKDVLIFLNYLRKAIILAQYE